MVPRPDVPQPVQRARAAAAPYVASVVIPAYNEGEVIARCLTALLREDAGGPLEIVVAANGCTDDTVARACAFEDVTVLDLPAAGKPGALNAADAVATAFPRLYLDADIVLGPGALRHLVAALTTDAARCAAPGLRFDLSGCSYPVRAYYDVFERLPSATGTLVGRGVYGVSRAGRARFGTFPEVQGDDLFVGRLFGPGEHVAVPGEAVVRAPRTGRDLLAVRTRVARGNAQLAAADPARLGADGADFGATTERTARAMSHLALSRPRLWPALAVYTGVTVAARLRARRTAAATTTWNRDESTRRGAP